MQQSKRLTHNVARCGWPNATGETRSKLQPPQNRPRRHPRVANRMHPLGVASAGIQNRFYVLLIANWGFLPIPAKTSFQEPLVQITSQNECLSRLCFATAKLVQTLTPASCRTTSDFCDSD